MPQRDGTRRGWNSDYYAISDVALRVWNFSGTTSTAGALTVTIPAGAFTTVLGVCATAVRNTTDPTQACFALVRSYSATQVVVQVFESKTSGVLIGGVVEGLEATGSAVAVLVTVFGI